MNLRDLQYMVALAEQKHYGRAAQACHVSQPTLSGQIAKLEAGLGVTIFQKLGRTVGLTDAGEEIIAHARKALAAARDIEETARAHKDPLSGRLRLGVIPTLGPYLMPYVLPQAAEKLPHAPLALVEDLTGHLVPLVSAGKLDAALIATSDFPPELTSIELFDEPFWVVTPSNHPLLAKKSLRTSDIDPASLLLLTDGHCLRDQTLDLCGHPLAGGKALADMRATSLETLLHLTAADYGITLAPQLAIECGRTSIDQLAFRPLEGEGTSRRVRLIWRRNSPRAKALMELARIVRAALPESLRKIDK
ncbi:MAG: LysR family transcriptional regulator [Alphaproteobacteria bacterium]|nr:LysR family transcriptional regulator [Alphaproteobacteria bacterium]